MKNTIAILLLIMCVSIIYSQENDTIDKTYKDINDLNKQTSEGKIELFKYVDSTFLYEVNIPDWLTLMETGDPELWGGIFPAIDGIENAILITGFHKNEFKSFKDFKNKIIEDDKFGEPTQRSSNHIFMGKKVLDEIPDIGPAYLSYYIFGNKLYDCQYILTETKTAYIWINYTSTRETYSKNLAKFEEFVKGFNILEK